MSLDWYEGPGKVQTVSETHESVIQRVGRWGWLARVSLLLVLFGLFFLLAAPIALWQFGPNGLWAAATATGVCLLAGCLAMGATAMFAPPDKPAAHVLVGMAIRMSLPLLACLLITQQSTWLTEAGFAWFLVAAFSLGLAFETGVSVGQLQTPSPSARRDPKQGRGDGSSADQERTSREPCVSDPTLGPARRPDQATLGTQ